jgi:serine/threonine-protein kinase
VVSPGSPSADQAHVTPGTILAGKYRVERILGQGGMGVVVEARHLALEERVALKFLVPSAMPGADATARFLREARAAAKIKSEHVARVSDVGTLESGAPYMVMEFLEGSDLAHLLKQKGPLPVPDAVDYLIQGSEAIAEAHSHGIVHRDLKPANLFLTRRRDGSPLVKVLDFGISKRMGPGVDNLTKTSTALGSALYMSPEQMQETRTVDHRTDIYALGVSLFELLAATTPFMAETLPQLCAAVLTGTPRPLRSFRADVPEALAAVIARACERDLARRYQSVGELVVDLAPFAPPRSYMTLERVAKMCGVEPPALARISSPPDEEKSGSVPPPATLPQGTRGPSAAPWMESVGALAQTAEAGDLVSPAPPAQPRASSPSGTDFRRASPSGFPERTSPVPPVTYSSTQPLPAINEQEAGSPEADEIPSKVVVSGYVAPFSAKASAAFASSALRPSAIPPEPRRPSGISPVVLAFFAIGLAALAAIVVAIILRMRALPDDAGEGSLPGPESAVTAPAVTAPAAPPPPETAQRPEVAPEVAPPQGASASPEGSGAPAATSASPASSPARPSSGSIGRTPIAKTAPPKAPEAPKPGATGKGDHGILSNSR